MIGCRSSSWYGPLGILMFEWCAPFFFVPTRSCRICRGLKHQSKLSSEAHAADASCNPIDEASCHYGRTVTSPVSKPVPELSAQTKATCKPHHLWAAAMMRLKGCPKTVNPRVVPGKLRTRELAKRDQPSGRLQFSPH